MFILQYRLLCKNLSALSLCNHVHSSAVLLARSRLNRKRPVPYEPGVRHWENSLQGDMKFQEKLDEELRQEFENEYDMGEDIDLINTEIAHDLHLKEQKKRRREIGQKITVAKFFAPRAQPVTLTWNERQCIKNLHKEDPVQWNIKSLSESFPATPETIRKILKSKAKITPERAKLLDMKAQKNWELLAEGKLDADPHVLEHLKKFFNRREVLLEQKSNANFYLPEVKNEPVWNQGEMNTILVKYEKALEKLNVEAKQNQKFKALKDGEFEEEKTKKEEKSSLDMIHEEIKMKSMEDPELKDSFLLKDMISTFNKHTTFEEFQNELLRKAEKHKKLALTEKAILESKMKMNNRDKFMNLNKRESPNVTQKNESITSKRFQKKQEAEKIWENARMSNIEIDNDHKNDNAEFKMIKSNRFTNVNSNYHHENTLLHEGNVEEFLNEVETKQKPEKTSVTETVTEEKLRINFSDPERLKRENEYYNKEVTQIENTAFWNNKKNSREKAMAEYEKQPHEGPSNSELAMKAKTVSFSNDDYPQKIKIPKNKRGSGLTFRIKDCYYDDNGEFLYRVPGLLK